MTLTKIDIADAQRAHGAQPHALLFLLIEQRDGDAMKRAVGRLRNKLAHDPIGGIRPDPFRNSLAEAFAVSRLGGEEHFGS